MPGARPGPGCRSRSARPQASHGPHDLFRAPDGQPVQLRGDRRGGVQPVRVLRAAVPAGDVVAVVADHQQRAARRDRRRRGAEDAREAGGRQVDVGDEDEVEAAGRGLVVQQVGLHPVHAHRAFRGQPGGPGEAGGGEVHRGDLPAALGEPDRVAPLAGAQVDRPPGWQRGHFLGDEAVRAGAPDQVRARVALVPGRLFRGFHYCPLWSCLRRATGTAARVARDRRRSPRRC